jgi:hypothetical protein
VSEVHLALIHDPTDVQVLVGCRQYSIEQWVGQKRADFVLDWCRTIRTVAEGKFFKFLQ